MVSGPPELPRSLTHPVQVLWGLGVQLAAVQTPGVHVPTVHVPGAVQTPAVQVPKPQDPPLFWQGVFDVYCDLEQALLPVQVLGVVSAPFEQVPAAVQVPWLVLPDIEQMPVVQVLW